MGLIGGLIARTMILAIGSFYAVLVLAKLIYDTIKLGPLTAFSQKKRTKPPPCLEDPDLGVHGYAHLENIRMHYVSNGDENKPLMLLVHGFPEFWYSWRYQLKEFKDKYRVVAVDLRGYGDSDKPPGKGNYTVPQLINDLKQLVTALGYKQCVLVAHDWGGALAWSFAEVFPDTVSHLIILNCGNGRAFRKHLRTSFAQFKMSWYMFFFQLPWLPELLFRFNDFDVLDEMMLRGTMGVKSGLTSADDMEAYKYNFSRNSITEPINFYRSTFSLASLSRNFSKVKGIGNEGISMPTLVVWGDQDTAPDKAMAEMSIEICKNKAVIKYVEGASHWVQMDQPEVVNKHIRDFLAES